LGSAISASLRLDLDALVVGEMRDRDSAQTSFTAAMTVVQGVDELKSSVFSTLGYPMALIGTVVGIMVPRETWQRGSGGWGRSLILSWITASCCR